MLNIPLLRVELSGVSFSSVYTGVDCTFEHPGLGICSIFGSFLTGDKISN